MPRPVERVNPGTVPYEVLEPPLPLNLFRQSQEYVPRDEALAQHWVDWLAATESDRSVYVATVLASAGAPGVSAEESPGDLIPLGSWLEQWLPLVFEREFGPNWLDGELFRYDYDDPPRPVQESPAEVLFQSLIHDLAFIVISAARVIRPDLRWQVHAWVNRAAPLVPLYLATLWSEPPWINPIGYVGSFVNNVLVQTRYGERGGPPPEYLQQICDRLGGDEREHWPRRMPLAPGELETLLARDREMRAAERPMHPPRRSDPPAPPGVVTAAAAFRGAGSFARWSKLSDDDLARALAAAWLRMDWEDLPEDPEELDWSLLIFDADRTVYEDAEADVSMGNKIYVAYLRMLSKRSGGAFRITNVKEDWKSQPGSVVVSFRLGNKRHQLVLAVGDDWINPFVITGLNNLLPNDGSRFFFVDNGGQMALVTRATEEERRALEELRPVRLLSEPPDWWLSVGEWTR